MDFDADRIYYSHQNLHQQASSSAGDGAAAAPSSSAAALDEEDRQVDADALRRHYREFLSELELACEVADAPFQGRQMRRKGRGALDGWADSSPGFKYKTGAVSVGLGLVHHHSTC